MKLREKIYRAATYGFIVFIVGIIIISFGMPDFLGKGGDSDKFLAARVGKEAITRKEVQNMKTNMLRMPQFQSFASQEEFLTRYALDYLISEKLQVSMQKETGIYPLADAKNSLVARFLKKNFKEFQTNEGFDFPRFEKEFLKPQRISFADIESQAVRESVFKNRALIEQLGTVSGYELADMHLLKNTRISYDILVFSPDEKRKLLKNLIGITEKDIQDKFSKDYLSKDKKDTLTEIKREAITQSLINEKRAKVEKEWMTNLNNEAKTLTLAELTKKYGGVFVSLNNIGLTESITQAAKNSKANLNVLENSSEFVTGLSINSTGKIQGPWNIEDNLFLITVRNLTRPSTDLAANNSKELESEIKNRNTTSADQLMDDLLKKDTKVKRFNHGED